MVCRSVHLANGLSTAVNTQDIRHDVSAIYSCSMTSTSLVVAWRCSRYKMLASRNMHSPDAACRHCSLLCPNLFQQARFTSPEDSAANASHRQYCALLYVKSPSFADFKPMIQQFLHGSNVSVTKHFVFQGHSRIQKCSPS